MPFLEPKLLLRCMIDDGHSAPETPFEACLGEDSASMAVLLSPNVLGGIVLVTGDTEASDDRWW